jgi:tetratricopeptide (TPR) repeat protein
MHILRTPGSCKCRVLQSIFRSFVAYIQPEGAVLQCSIIDGLNTSVDLAMTKRITKGKLLQFKTVERASPRQASGSALEQAQQLIYEAWEEPSESRKKQLAEKAIGLSKDCADAYIIMAECAKTDARVGWYRKAVAAGERALGKGWEKRYRGIGWDAIETRPAMRAMEKLARTLQWEDEFDEALALYRALLELNPNDNQGTRYWLAPCLLEMRRYDELNQLFKAYPNDAGATFPYTKALARFIKYGATDLSTAALKAAYQSNPHVPKFLADFYELPDQSPDIVEIGEETEAIAYAVDNAYLWEADALIWVADVLGPQLKMQIKDPDEYKEFMQHLRGE